MRWFAYATFGHTATSLDNPVNPAEDELDTISNITPHVEFMENALYEYLPGLSRGGGTGVPTPSLRLECTRVDLVPGSEKAFEGAIGKEQAKLQDETLWYRMVVGGAYPRYVRLRPRQSLSAVLDGRSEQALPDETSHVIAKTTIEVWTLKPLLSLGVELPPKSAGSK
jgi:hypothetical protein